MLYISSLTGKEVSKATYYRHIKKSQSQSQSQSWSQSPWYSDKTIEAIKKIKSQSHEKVVPSVQDIVNDWQDVETRYQRLKDVFKHLFLAASSRGIPKKIVLECERFL